MSKMICDFDVFTGYEYARSHCFVVGLVNFSKADGDRSTYSAANPDPIDQQNF